MIAKNPVIDSPREHEATKDKKKYSTPEFVEYGSVAELTRARIGTRADAFSRNKKR